MVNENSNLIELKKLLQNARSRLANAVRFKLENEQLKVDGCKFVDEALEELLNVYETALLVYVDEGLNSWSFYPGFGKEILAIVDEYHDLIEKDFPFILRCVPHIEYLKEKWEREQVRREEFWVKSEQVKGT